MAESDPRPFAAAPPGEAHAPDGVTIYAIGDLHGRADLLELLIEQIRADRAGSRNRTELIFLGDYIDRGPASDAVIDQVLDLQHDPDFAVTTLKGNHESLALQFLADPVVGSFWCQIGGRQTLLSYGVTPPMGPSDMEQWEDVRQAFQAALPATHLCFLQQLSTYVVRGGYVFVHAGLRPGVKLARQREWDMLWIRNEFLNHRGRFEKVVVHGHTPDEKPFFGSNRIGIDTGADQSGRLTGLKLFGAERRLMSAGMPSSRMIDQSVRPVLQPLAVGPSLPSFGLPAVNAAGLASIPWQQAFSAKAWRAHPILPGLAALAAIGLLVTVLTAVSSEGPPPDARPVAAGADSNVDDLIARADALLKTPLGRAPMHGIDSTRPTVAPEAGASGPTAASGPSMAAQTPTRSTEVPATATAAAATMNPDRPSGDKRATTRISPDVAKAERVAVATSIPDNVPASKQTAPRAVRPDLPSPGSSQVVAATRAPKPLPSRQDKRRATDIALATPDVVQQVDREPVHGGRPDADVAIEPPAAFTRAVPIESANHIGPLDYPKGSVRLDEEGVVGVRYVVAADGRVSACATTEPSSFVRLNRRTCQLIRSRFRFIPALKNGQPVEDVREQRIRWELSG